jgi:hypothetical protein
MQQLNNRQLTLPLVKTALKPDRLYCQVFRQTVFRLPRKEKSGSSELGDGEKVTLVVTINISDYLCSIKSISWSTFAIPKFPDLMEIISR